MTASSWCWVQGSRLYSGLGAITLNAGVGFRLVGGTELEVERGSLRFQGLQDPRPQFVQNERNSAEVAVPTQLWDTAVHALPMLNVRERKGCCGPGASGESPAGTGFVYELGFLKKPG